MGNPFGDVKVHRTFTLFRLTIATAMPLRATGQSALPERPKIPNPGKKSGLGSCTRARPKSVIALQYRSCNLESHFFKQAVILATPLRRGFLLAA